MNGVKTEEGSELILPDQMDSPSVDEGSSGGSSGGVPVLKKGPWTSAEDAILMDYVKKNGEGNWNAVQKNTGLFRCGKSCRLRWANHLRPNLKKGAFTPEEENLIIELHAKMGNKWARMAAYLPGRTDNEIKNYWNTRVKRCQRASLPLYPPNIFYQIPDEDHSEFTYGENQSNDLLQENVFYMHANTCDNMFAARGSSDTQPFTDFSVNGVFSHSFGSNNGLIPGRSSTITEPEKFLQTLGYNYPYAGQNIKKLVPFDGAIMGSHALLNGEFSTSTRPMLGPVKSELPSLQDTQADPGSWFDYSAAPAAASVESEHISAGSSGLLEAVLHQPQALSGGKNQPSINNTTSELDPCHELLEYSGPVSPLSHCAASVFSDCTPQALDELAALMAPPTYVGESVQNADEISPWPENLRPDTLLESGWLDEGSPSTKEQFILNEAISTILREDAYNDYRPPPSGAPPSGFGQGRRLDSLPWNNMPRACQMSEFP